MRNPRSYKNFSDRAGRSWSAGVFEERGPDYKGRYFLVFFSGDDLRAPLTDVRWNSEDTARRTIETMSDVELRRRLKVALGRSGSVSRSP